MLKVLGVAVAASTIWVAAAGRAESATTINVPAEWTDYDVWEDLPAGPGAYLLTFTSSTPLTYLYSGYWQEVEAHAHADRGDAGWRYIYEIGEATAFKSIPNGFSFRFIVSPGSAKHYSCCIPDTTQPGEMIGYEEHITYTPKFFATMSWDPTGAPVTLSYFVSPIPEPGMWALAVAGLTLAGAAIRRSRRLVVNEA
ncbi:PEP-CTERM sorting domain-containing protein [Phenylobacterium sp.]|uniref:PEP-CTERM sorting domain-containing protein n=1 Tax=Phenylobacterium sp. TaxID=1871053 RepID=UPI0035B0C458